MKPSHIMMIGAGVVCLTALAFWIGRPVDSSTARNSETRRSTDTIVADLHLPELTGTAQVGKRIFDTACLSCHGENAAGQDGVAPPLVHKIYEPSHHADEAFQRAVALGVRAHHWPFGDMPPVEGISRGEVAMVIRYLRELQRANGIN